MRAHLPSISLMSATLTLFLSPHLNSLPIQRTLARNKRASFPVPCLISSAILLALSLPLALVPYYLLPALPDASEAIEAATPLSVSGVFGRLPGDDDWVNIARVLQCALGLATCNQWILRGRDSILGGLGVERGERYRLGRWVGLGLWFVVVSLACIGGWVVEKIQLLGIISTLAVCWLLPCKSPSPTCKCIGPIAHPSRLLHHHIPRPFTSVYCIPIAESTPTWSSPSDAFATRDTAQPVQQSH